MGGIDRAEQVPSLLDGKAGGLAVGGVVLAAADRLKGVERCGVAGNEGVEEVAQDGPGQSLIGSLPVSLHRLAVVLRKPAATGVRSPQKRHRHRLSHRLDCLPAGIIWTGATL